MAQASQQEHIRMKGIGFAENDVGTEQLSKDQELERMRKLLAAKDAEIAALKFVNESTADGGDQKDQSTADGGDDCKLPPKTDVCSLLSNHQLYLLSNTLRCSVPIPHFR